MEDVVASMFTTGLVIMALAGGVQLAAPAIILYILYKGVVIGGKWLYSS